MFIFTLRMVFPVTTLRTGGASGLARSLIDKNPIMGYHAMQPKARPIEAWDVVMINDVYNKKILGFAADIPHLGRLPVADATAVAHSRLCGSKVTVDLKMHDGVVTDFGHDVKACALGQASSSIMARHVIGSRADELRDVRMRMHAMLKEQGDPPTGKWEELEALLPVRDYKARHASTLLTFDAVVDAVSQIEAKQGADA
jgi:NifU-like protein involved in Fe-S cluster formation